MNNSGIYAGVQWMVMEKKGKKYIAIQAANAVMLMEQKADMHLLDDIGDKDPEEVMEALFASIPEKAE
ncbi:MAG: hypothetical protein AAB948_02145 [Patescibacteria group bacterium]